MPCQSVFRLFALRNADSEFQNRLAVDLVLALAGHEIVRERRVGHAALPVAGRDLRLLLDAEARHAGELDQVAAVAGFGELGDAADAADAKQVRPVLGAGMRRIGLDHADEAVAVAQRVVDHLQIARLENVERHLAARQQQGARQRKHRDRAGQIVRAAIDGVHRHERTRLLLRSSVPDPVIRRAAGSSYAGRRSADRPCAAHNQANSTDDSFLRPPTVASSVGPQASKN